MGLPLTGVMDGWTRMFKEKLAAVWVTLDIIVKYVDDINMGIRPIPKGIRWSKEWQLQWDPDQMLVDMYLTPTQYIDRCVGLIRELADTVTTGIKFTVDVPHNYPHGRVHMLDTEVWMERGDGTPGNRD